MFGRSARVVVEITVRKQSVESARSVFTVRPVAERKCGGVNAKDSDCDRQRH